jgi:hypothetical protein
MKITARGLLRHKPSPAMAVALVALFVALGGTSYAATGGNFILGQPNGAGTPTQLTSGTANDAGTLKVTNTATSGGRAIQGTSAHGQGVYGHSGSNAGVVGDSNTFDGVFGTSNDSDSAGVSGHGDGGGYGVFASGGNVLFHTAAIHGQSAAGNGVEGISGQNTASGVYGQNNGTGYGVAGRANSGTGVLGDSSNGWAFNASGNATQGRGRGGFVKAMAFVDPAGHPSDPIQQCFNSQLAPAQATSGNCGFTRTTDSNSQNINFGFTVDDRFVSVTTEAAAFTASGTANGSTVYVSTWNNQTGYAFVGFYIIVF